MPKLFRKFLAIIWLSVVGSVLATTFVLTALEAGPALSQLALQERQIVLDLAQAVLKEEGEAAALRFAVASENTRPVGLSISVMPADGACTNENTPEIRTVFRDAKCYRISVLAPEGLVPQQLAPLLLGLAILVSTTLAAVLLTRYLVSPVVALRDGLSALARGHFSTRISDKLARSTDEIAALAGDFDTTAERLQMHQDAQQRLFHDVSHELRSPLSRLQAVAGILRKNPTKLATMLDRMEREVERLDMLVGEVLMLARLSDPSNVPLRTQKLDLIEILNDILADAAFEAQTRGVTFTTDIEATFIADADGELIYRALENVIRNAAKHTAEGSHVDVRYDVVDDVLILQIADQGDGVAEDELERIFLPFSRSVDAETGKGYGLGLAIVRQAIERHGGRVYARLPRSGGLTVTLQIPRHPAGPASRPERREKVAGVSPPTSPPLVTPTSPPRVTPPESGT